MIRWRHLPVHSLLIERHGAIVLDAYFNPFADNQLHDVASVTKSVVSTLVGIAEAKQQLTDVNTPVSALLPESKFDADPRKARLTLAHLLSMTSGLDCGDRDGQNFLQQMEHSPHWTSFAFQRDETAWPGTSFNYCAVNMELVSAVLSRETGNSAADFAQRELFGPLGIRSFYWPTDADGISHGYADLRLQPRDMAKLGYLWLHHGVWEDRKLVPSAYLDAALSPHADVSANVKYGYGLWLYPNGRAGCQAHFEANGNGGQRIAVIPSKDMVVVITGAGLNADDVLSLVAPAWRWNNPLAPNPQANARLAADLARPAQPSDLLMAGATAAKPASTLAAPAPIPATNASAPMARAAAATAASAAIVSVPATTASATSVATASPAPVAAPSLSTAAPAASSPTASPAPATVSGIPPMPAPAATAASTTAAPAKAGAPTTSPTSDATTASNAPATDQAADTASHS
jgi:CubicO group peptidase (beta-lactamase class C family)